MQALELCFEFKTGEKRRVFMEILNLILNKDKQIEGGKGMSRHYLVKKINRYGVKQKRLTWFDFADSTFNISTVENKGTKQFAIKKIMHFMKKANNCIVVEFYKEVNAKKLSLVFSNEEELNECMELAQRMQRALRESKFQSKQSVIFKEVVLQNKEGRKFTWLAKNVTEATSTKNQEHQFYYNVLQVGIISHEKRYLVLDYFTKEIMFLNNRNKVLRTMKIANFTIKYYMQNPLKIMITSVKSSIELIFPSVYIKFHFASNCYMIKSPEKVFPSSAIMKTPIKVYTSSWNIGQKAEPTPETLQIFLSSSENHQIIALGFQECKLNKFNLWLKALTSYYSEREKVLLSYISMWGMFLVVYIEKSLLSNVTDIVTLKKATGVANIIGNKGGVLMSFRLEDTSFCFLSCHLAARFNRLLLRNQNAKDLLNLRPSVENLEFSVEFDYTFWIGDFNYRIEEDFYKAIQMIGDQQFEVLWPNDQMLQQVSSNQMYATFREGILKFKPTYRLIPSHDEWSNKREQTPSWTDRIIFKSHNPIEIHEYSNIDNCYGSDHRPIFASFTTEVRNWYVPENLSMLSDDNKFGVLELQNLSINYTEETFLTHAMLTFHSAHLESEPKSSQVPLTSEKTIVFLGETLPILFFIFPNPDILKDLRFTIILNLLNIEGAKETAGYASIPIRKVVEFIQKNYEVDYRISFNTNLSALLEVDLEINSKIVGKVQGAWTFNICSRSEQYRF